MENRLEEFKTYLFDKERSINTVDSYARSVGVYFKKYDEVNKKNMMEFKQWQIEQWKPRTAAIRCISMNVYCDFIGHPEYKVKNIKVYDLEESVIACIKGKQPTAYGFKWKYKN